MTERILEVGVLMILLLCSCSSKVLDNEEAEVDIYAMSDKTIDEYVDSVYYLGLNPGETSGPRRIGKLRINNSIIYLSNGIVNSDKIYAYDEKTGNLLFVLDSMGNGPEEYNEIRNYAIHDNGLYIIDNTRQRLMKFDATNGDYISHVAMPVIADDIEILDSGRIIFATTPIHPSQGRLSIPQERNRLFIYDSNMNYITGFLPVEEGYEDPFIMRHPFTRNGDTVYYSSPMYNGFYSVIDGEDVKLLFHDINFRNGMEGRKEIDGNRDMEYEKLVDTPLVSGNNMILNYSDGKGNVVFGMWNKNERGMLINPSENVRKAMLPVIGMSGNSFLSYIDDYDMYESITGQGFIKAPVEVENILKNEGAALIYYRMK